MHSDYARAALTQMGIVPLRARQADVNVDANSKDTEIVPQAPKGDHQRQVDSKVALEKLKSQIGRVEAQDLSGKVLINFSCAPRYQQMLEDVLRALGLEAHDTHCSDQAIEHFTGQSFCWTLDKHVSLSEKQLKTPSFEQWDSELKASLWRQISRN